MTAIDTLHSPLADFHNPPDDKHYELIEGKLVERKMGLLSLWIASQICNLIDRVTFAQRLGWALTELPISCFTWFTRPHGRRPDVVYYTIERLPVLTQDPVTIAPDLVVEVLSPNDNIFDVDAKISEYLRAGVKLVWIVNPDLQTVRVHRQDGTIQMFHKSDTITGEAVIPTFSATVSGFFPPANEATSQNSQSK